MYRSFIKRLMDFCLALLAILVLSPVLLITALLVRIKLGSPVLFKQQRPGLREKIFTMYKFRTMTDERDKDGNLQPDAIRLTRFGRFLRSTSLDELPELFNILKGDMSIIGPRPLLVQYLPLYNEHQKRRHDVRPGLSGLAQISGRNAIGWERKFDLDVQYTRRITFLGDLRIICLTMLKAVRREGINSAAAATMEPFTGTKPSRLIIIGAGGHGKVVADAAEATGQWDDISYADNNMSLRTAGGRKVIGTIGEAMAHIGEASFFVAIGNNQTRTEIQAGLESAGADMATIIHPGAIVGSGVEFGAGTVVMAGAVINCDAKIGRGCIINTGATVDHDNEIGDYVHISPGAHLAGAVSVGRGSWVGIGSAICNNVAIAGNCVVGAGAVVIREISEAGTYAGVPARRL